jgi:putative hydrolase of the HAD superfamily
MFEAVLDRAGVSADQCIHVGDHLIDDIEGANNAGMHSLWVNLTEQVRTEDQAKANIEVTNLEELPAALEAYQGNL